MRTPEDARMLPGRPHETPPGGCIRNGEGSGAVREYDCGMKNLRVHVQALTESRDPAVADQAKAVLEKLARCP
jgi:hypothetical protein